MSKLLDEYRRKRSADRTPEPMGAGAARPGVFVVQKHSASRMHYDLRLEWDCVLWRPVGDPPEGVRAGKLLFELKGFKLKGMWTLVRIKGETGKEWLLIKETGDGHVRRGVAEPYEDSSILSG